MILVIAAPSAPQSFVVPDDLITSASVTLRWRNPTKSGGAVSYYQLQYRRSEGQQEQGNTRSKRQIGMWVKGCEILCFRLFAQLNNFFLYIIIN